MFKLSVEHHHEVLQRVARLASSVLRDPYYHARIQEWIRNQLTRPKKHKP